MNKDKLIQLLEDGAEFRVREDKFVHPSFRKGFRALHVSNISWAAVQRVHGPRGTNRLSEANGVIRLDAHNAIAN